MIDQENLLSALRTVKDPELNVNVVDLGLVYSIQTRDDQVDVEMTLTSPACPVGPEMLRNAVTALGESRGHFQSQRQACDVASLVARQDDRRRPRRTWILLIPHAYSKRSAGLFDRRNPSGYRRHVALSRHKSEFFETPVVTVDGAGRYLC